MTAQLRLIPVLTFALIVPAAGAGQVTQPRDAVPGAQAAPAGTGSIGGTVTMASTGQPARKVRVSLSGAEIRGSRAATTDDQGRFLFTALPPGRYGLSASRPGHMTVSYGQRLPGRPGTQIQLSDGQKFEAHLQIPKNSVITGTVFDENGEPAPQIPVRAMRIQVQNGERTSIGSNVASTDDRGIYRIFGLQPGDYVVCATPRNQGMNQIDGSRIELQALQAALQGMAARDDPQARGIRERIASLRGARTEPPDDGVPSGYAPVCYPGTIGMSSASPIALAVAEERPAVDFQLQLAPMARVEGTVLNPTGSPLRDIQVRLTDLTQMSDGLGSTTARADSEGRFRLPSVAPGQYRLTARATFAAPRPEGAPAAPVAGRGRGRGEALGRADAVTLWAAADIVVDGRNVSNVMLSLQPGITVSGQLRFEGSAQPPQDLARMRVTMTPYGANPPGGAANGRVDAAGRFTIASVVPGRYRMTASGANGWFVESAAIGGQDALDIPIEIKGNQNLGSVTITFTDRQTELSGTMIDSRSQPATDYTLVVFPSDPRYWMRNARRIQTARPATDGRFTFRNLPAGEYLLAPVLDLEPGTAYDAMFLQQLEVNGIRLTLQPGEKKIQDLTVGR